MRTLNRNSYPSTIGGRTVQSWAGIGLGQLETSLLIAEIRKHKSAKENWQSTQILVIDESERLQRLRLIGKRA